MSTGQVAALVVAAVLVFWMLGAYNRLVALRNAVAAAWAQVEEALTRRNATLGALAETARDLLAGQAGALDALQAGLAEVAAAAETLRPRPVAAASAAGFVRAGSQLSAATARVLALLDGHADAAASEPVQALLAALRESDPRVDFARQLFNEAAQAYDEAAQQFPTRLLTRLYGFGPAGRL